METKLAETDSFINEIDGRLNSLVANIDANPDKNLDKLKILKTEIDEYEQEIRDLLQNYDMMSSQDQLDNSGQIEIQVKGLQNKFETIQEDISVLITQMKQLLEVKVRLSSCCETIKSWINDVDKQIVLVELASNPSEMPERKLELEDIKLQFIDQLEYLKNIDIETKSLLSNSESDAMQFPDLVAKLKESEKVIHDLSLRLRINIRSSSRRSSRSDQDSRSNRSSISIKSQTTPLNSTELVEVSRKSRALVQELNSNINAVNQYLLWTNDLLKTITTDISSVTFEGFDDKNFKSFVEVILASRQKIDLVRGLEAELKQIIKNNNLINVKDYSPEAVEDIQKRWEETYSLCVERDRNNKLGIDSSESDKLNVKRLIGSSQRGDSYRSINSRNSNPDSRRSSYKEANVVDELSSLEQWMAESRGILQKKADFGNVSKICKSGLRPIRSELESLGHFINGYINRNRIYDKIIILPNLSATRAVALSDNWNDLRKMLEAWIENMQKILLESSDVQKQLVEIANQIRKMQNEPKNPQLLSDSFIDIFDQVKNHQKFWKVQVEPLSSFNHHHFTMNRKLTDRIDLIMNELMQLDRSVYKISQAIVESDTPQILNSGSKRHSPTFFEDDTATTAPIPTSLSFSDEEDLANNSSLMVPSICSFEQPYVPVVSGDLNRVDANVRLRDIKLFHRQSPTANPIPLNCDIQRLAQGDCSSPVIQTDDEPGQSSWSKDICRYLSISIPIIFLIILILCVIFMLQPQCENNWECSSPLSGVTVKKHWSKSAAI